MLPRLDRVFYGWWIVAITLVVNATVTGVFFFGMSVFFLPISRDLGVSRAATALPISIARLLGVIQGPIMGALVDRFGPSKVLFACATVGGLGYLLLSNTSSYTMYMVVFIAVISLGLQSGFDASTMTTVSRWFTRKRGIALSLMSVGFALGGAVVTPLVALSINAYGWRTTAFIIGILMWIIVLPLSTRLYRSPESRGLQPDGGTLQAPRSVTQIQPSSPDPFTDFTLREAIATRTYWHLAITLGLRSMVWGALLVHMVAIMKWKGLDESMAGVLIGLMALIAMPVALLMGWLGDRYPKRHLVTAGDCVSAISLVLLLLLDRVEVWHMVIVFLLWSPNQGNWPLNWAMLAEQFGRKHFGVLRGGIISTMSFLSFGAPLYSGWVFDRTESYFWALAPAVFLLVTAAFCTWATPAARKSYNEIK